MLRKKKSVLAALIFFKKSPHKGDSKMIFVKGVYSCILLQLSLFCVSMEGGI